MSNTYNLFIIMLNKHKKSIDFSEAIRHPSGSEIKDFIKYFYCK